MVALIPPSLATLKKYGLSMDEWCLMFGGQMGVCPICEKFPSSGRFVIDHEHVKGWKAMSPERRKLYVRGITCWFCNHSYLGRGITIDKAENVVRYLTAYEQRRVA